MTSLATLALIPNLSSLVLEPDLYILLRKETATTKIPLSCRLVPLDIPALLFPLGSRLL